MRVYVILYDQVSQTLMVQRRPDGAVFTFGSTLGQ